MFMKQYCNSDKPGRQLHPVNCVDWEQANQYAKFKGARLPSDAEYEYAATSGGKNQKYPWGNEDETCDKAVMSGKGDYGCGSEATMPVCSKPAGNTAKGLCDMVGNVWQRYISPDKTREWTYTRIVSPSRALLAALLLLCGRARADEGDWARVDGLSLRSASVASPAGVPVERGAPAKVGLLQVALAVGKGPTFLSKACAQFISTLPPDLDYGLIQVPKDASASGGERLNIFYYGRFYVQGKTPIILVNGGPGSSSWNMYRTRTKEASALVGLPFVFFDQRGNGCSSPYPAASAYGAADGSYSSTAIVRDMEAIRREVYGAGTRWKVFGQSFGSVVVHRYALLAPEGLAAGYAHGFALKSDWRDYRRVHREYEIEFQRRYFERHPEDRDCLRSTWERLVARDCPGAASSRERLACVKPYADGIDVGFRDPGQWAKTHEGIAAFCSAAPARPETAPKRTEKPLDDQSAAIHTIVVQEYLPPGYDPADPFACQAAFESLVGRLDWHDLIFFQSCDRNQGAQLEHYRRNSARAASYLSLADFKRALNSRGDFRFRLYSGELDPYSPPPYFEDEARELEGRISYRMIRGGGHFDWEPIFADIKADP